MRWDGGCLGAGMGWNGIPRRPQGIWQVLFRFERDDRPENNNHLPDLQSTVCHDTGTSASSDRISVTDCPEVRLSVLQFTGTDDWKTGNGSLLFT